MKYAALVSVLLISSCFAQTKIAAAATPNLSPEFAKAALKALLADRDFEDPAPFTEALEDTEVQVTTKAEHSALEGLKSYDNWRTFYMKKWGVSLQAAAMAEASSPGKCFSGLKAQYSSRIWIGTPKECSE